MNENNNVATYTPSARPTRFENLWPGSFFSIVAEPSRNIRRSKDARVYQKSFNGFFAEHPATGVGCCLMPHDIVQPMRRLSNRKGSK